MVARSDGLREGDLLTVAEALRILPIGKSKLYALLADGEIEHVRVPSTGGRRARLFIPRAALEAFVERHRVGARGRRVAPVDADDILRRVRGGSCA